MDRPTLYREGPRIDRCKWCGWSGVKVEPVLIVTDDWTPVDSLPEGYTYAIVKLDNE